MTKRQIQIDACAKINLSLTVGKPTADGMHPIESKIVRIAVFDTLEVTRLEDQSNSTYTIKWHEDAPRKSDIDWPEAEDLAVRAHRLLEQHVGYSLPIQMEIVKYIPVGGGLGGGSSDAAAMLRAIIQLFDLMVNPQDLAIKLGSDVSFFLCDGAAMVCGAGADIQPLPFETMNIVLIIPTYGCSTVEVFNAFDSMEEPHEVNTNDLLVPACAIEERLHKDIDSVKRITQLDIHLSGSGSTMFAICNNAEHAKELAIRIQHETGLVSIATHTC